MRHRLQPFAREEEEIGWRQPKALAAVELRLGPEDCRCPTSHLTDDCWFRLPLVLRRDTTPRFQALNSPHPGEASIPLRCDKRFEFGLSTLPGPFLWDRTSAPIQQERQQIELRVLRRRNPPFVRRCQLQPCNSRFPARSWERRRERTWRV